MRLRVRVQPKASRDEILGWTDDGYLKVRVTSPPEEGKANMHLLRLLARALEIPRARFRIVVGETSREKVVEIEGDEEAILAALALKARGGHS